MSKTMGARRVRGLAVLTVLGAALPALGQNLVRMYQLTELKAGAALQTRAYAINSKGQIVGWMEADGTRHSAYWHNETFTDLHGTVHFNLEHPDPLFDQGYSEAYGLSDGGQVIGTARVEKKCGEISMVITNAYIVRPAVMTDLATPYPGDALTNLKTLGDRCAPAPLRASDSAATAISNRNHIVGWADRNDGIIHAFLVVPRNGFFFADTDLNEVNDYMVDLGTLAADADPVSSATAVNDAGQVTGYAFSTNGRSGPGYHAFLVTPRDVNSDGVLDWFSGGGAVNNLMADLGTLGGPSSWGRDINNAGDVVGESDFSPSATEHYVRAFLWRGGVMYDLGTLRSDPQMGFSAASAINDLGAIVGWAENDKRERRAFIYENGTMQDLNGLVYPFDDLGNPVSPGIVLSEARDINADGTIVGWGVVRGSGGTQTRGFLLLPVLVDPATLVATDPNDTSGSTPIIPVPNRSQYTSETEFGPPTGAPGVTSPDPETVVDGDSTPRPRGVLCGAGSAGLLPVALLGMALLRRRSA